MNTRLAASNVFGAIVSLVLVTSSAKALTISDGSSSADISPGSSAGMFNWFVGGNDQLVQQWFWYRIGGAPEAPINTIGAPAVGSLGPNQLTLTYTHALFSLQVDYLLTSPSFGQASIQEAISIINTSGNNLDFHFFQYSDFDLNGTAGGDFGALGTNIFGKFNLVDQIDGPNTFQETVLTPGSDHAELSFFPVILNKLNDGVATTLSDLPPAGAIIGPGDLTWGFQWDRVLTASGPGSSLAISKLKSIEIVPEPSTFAIGLMGLAAVRWMRRRC